MEVVKNYEVNSSGKLVASKDLNPGDLAICVAPLAVGPGRACKPVCLATLIRPEASLVPCSSCGWPVCNSSVESSPLHKRECSLLKTIKCDPATFGEESSNHLDFIHPLRILLQVKESSASEKDFRSLKVDLSRSRQRNVIKYGKSEDQRIIETIQKLMPSVSKEDIEKAIALVERHNVPLDHGARGSYLETTGIEHSCCPNLYFTGSKYGWAIFRASQEIRKGDLLTACRVPLDKCNYFRNKLLEAECIDCSCIRCMDGTEFGTGYGSISCSKKCSGVLSPVAGKGDWKCSSCNETRPGGDCTRILDDLDHKLELALKDLKQDTAEYYESLLKQEGEWGQVPANSQLIADIRKRLAYIYQYTKEFYFSQVDWLEKKVAHCEAWLELSQKLFPGRSYQGIWMEYERSNAVVSLLLAMKEANYPTEETNAMCNRVVTLMKGPINMMIQEEDTSMYKAFQQLVMITTEARETQKTRVYINRWADEDEEEW